MRYLVKLYGHTGDEFKEHRKIHSDRPYIEEVKGYSIAVESMAGRKVAYFTIEEIYMNE